MEQNQNTKKKGTFFVDLTLTQLLKQKAKFCNSKYCRILIFSTKQKKSFLSKSLFCLYEN